MSAGIDVSGLTFVPIPEEFGFDAVSSSSSGGGSITDLSNALIIAGGLAYFAYERRPRGSARDDLIEIRKSKVPGGNLGVFSKKYIAEGTSIGSFPGFLLSTEDALASSKSCFKSQCLALLYLSLRALALRHSEHLSSIYLFTLNFFLLTNCFFSDHIYIGGNGYHIQFIDAP